MVEASNELSLRDRILDAAEQVLRRHGNQKSNVIDVARVLGMSHGNIYRLFDSKKALLDAVAVRWLDRLSKPLAAIADDHALPAADRLVAWFQTLCKLKRSKVLDDPELFRVYHKQVTALRDVADEHVAKLLAQIGRIIADGIAAGEFSATLDPATAAVAFLQATARFHHPAMIALDPAPTEAEANAVAKLLLAGLRVGVG